MGHLILLSVVFIWVGELHPGEEVRLPLENLVQILQTLCGNIGSLIKADLESSQLLVGAVRTVDFTQTFLESVDVLVVPVVVVQATTDLANIGVSAGAIGLVVGGPGFQNWCWWWVCWLTLTESADGIHVSWSILLELATIPVLNKRIATATSSVVENGKRKWPGLSPAHFVIIPILKTRVLWVNIIRCRLQHRL